MERVRELMAVRTTSTGGLEGAVEFCMSKLQGDTCTVIYIH